MNFYSCNFFIDGNDDVMAQPGMVGRRGRGRGRGSGGTEDRAKQTRNVTAVHRGKVRMNMWMIKD